MFWLFDWLLNYIFKFTILRLVSSNTTFTSESDTTTKVGTTCRWRHSRWHYCSCYKNSKESRCDNRHHAVLWWPRQQCMQGSSFSHSGSTSHPPGCVSRWCKDSCDCVDVIPAGLLQLDTVRHLFIQPQQTTACTERPSVCHYDDQKRDHITPVLAHLHWLPVTARIQFIITLLTFKTLTTHQPSYIHDLLQLHCSSWQLRSASHNVLEIPRMRTSFVQRSFTYGAPHIWNSLPHVITGNLDFTANT